MDQSSDSSGCFRFFDLPYELRIKIYESALIVPERLVDLDPANFRRVAPRLQCFLASKQFHEEASRIFYGCNTFRIFPMHGRFFHTKKPLLTRLPSHYLSYLTSLELRFGPGWGSPPRCQKVDESLGLESCSSLRLLRVFVELDPSQDVFNGFRGHDNAVDAYKIFCVSITAELLARAPSIVAVEFDAYPSVGKRSPLVVALRSLVEEASKVVIWGPLREWDKDPQGYADLSDELSYMTLRS